MWLDHDEVRALALEPSALAFNLLPAHINKTVSKWTNRKTITFFLRNGNSGWILGKTSHRERCGSGTAAQGGGAVTVPGGVPEPCGCGTEGRGQGAWWGWAAGGTAGSERCFSTLMILLFCDSHCGALTAGLARPNPQPPLLALLQGPKAERSTELTTGSSRPTRSTATLFGPSTSLSRRGPGPSSGPGASAAGCSHDQQLR